MASASKTPNFNLPQWVGTEKPERTDFNAAFDVIDSFDLSGDIKIIQSGTTKDAVTHTLDHTEICLYMTGRDVSMYIVSGFEGVAYIDAIKAVANGGNFGVSGAVFTADNLGRNRPYVLIRLKEGIAYP